MLKTYDNRQALMNGLAQLVHAQLIQTIEKQDRASLALPGGTTPAPFLQALSQMDLDWSKVTVFAGDERFVDTNSDRSNAKLIQQNFIQNNAKSVNFISLVEDTNTPEQSVQNVLPKIQIHLPIDVLIVGMGVDMHTASLFPDSPNIEAALSQMAPDLVVIHAENAGEPRISLSGNVLKNAKHKHVLIAGEGKLEALSRAEKSKSEVIAPIRTVIASSNAATIHYAP